MYVAQAQHFFVCDAYAGVTAGATTLTSFRLKGIQESPRGRPTTRWSDYISDIAWSRLGAEPTQLSDISVHREEFRALLGLLAHDPPWKKSGHENK